ncbi:MAG: helix-turn-helix domain-containing protein [bacterium]
MCVVLVRAQDTVFVKKYTFDESVNNVDSDGKNLIVRTANKLYLLDNDVFKPIDNIDLSGGRYTWIRGNNKESGFATFNTNFIADEKQTSKDLLGDLLPGSHHPNITIAGRGKSFFLSYKGGVLEYEVNGFYKIEHKGKSVRCVYNDDTIKVTATYSGVFVDTTYLAFAEVPTLGGDYSNGEVSKINDKYYMCKDYIMVWEGDQWRRINRPMTNPTFLKLKERGGKVYFLSQQSVGVIDLMTGIVTDTLFDDHGVLYDMKWIGDQMIIAAEDGHLYFLSNDAEPEKILVGSCIYDINVNGDVAILSCKDGVYKYHLATKRVEKMFDLIEAVQSLYVENELLVSTFSGLYVVHNQQLYNLVPYVEFNKMALSQWEDRVFAGSIEGLYVIDRGQLIYDIIPGLTPYKVATTTPSTYIYIFLISLVVLFGILYFTIRKRQKKLQVEIMKRTKITPDSIRQVMLQNEQIISVEAVAEHFATSTVQLNRILKRYNTSGLALLKEIKGEIVLAMIEKQTPLDKISNRVGYSIAFIKRNYLKKLD